MGVFQMSDTQPKGERNKRKIEKALETKGYKLMDAIWEPVGGNIEMVGRSGGWTIIYKELGEELLDHIFGYSIGEVFEYIDKLPTMSEVSHDPT
jgi:hypothetical protein